MFYIAKGDAFTCAVQNLLKAASAISQFPLQAPGTHTQLFSDAFHGYGSAQQVLHNNFANPVNNFCLVQTAEILHGGIAVNLGLILAGSWQGQVDDISR
jgi:hypothetical protein